MPTKRDYYEVLGVTKTATAADIKSAYRKMALKYHPDRNKEKDAEQTFKEINEAYQVLSDPQKKQTYDQFGHAAFDPAAGGAAGNPFAGGFRTGGPFTWSYSTSSNAGGNPFEGMDFGDPFEMFESFFGGGAGRPRRPRYGLTIDFLDAVKGTEKTVEMNGKKRTIKVPAGTNDGTRLRFDDFDITFDVRPDPRFKRDGDDLYVDQEISYPVAVLGGTIEAQTVEGKIKVKVRPGTASHTLLRLRGEGVQHLQGRGKGDLYVRLIVKVPTRLSRDEKRLVEELYKLNE